MITWWHRRSAGELALAKRSFARCQSLGDDDVATQYARLRLLELTRYRLADDDSLVEAIALGAAAMKSSIGLIPYRVQHQAAMVMARGAIAEMATGEGKTICVALAAIALAVRGYGVHVATANDYLAERDCLQMNQVFAKLGLTAGLVKSQMTNGVKRSAYDCDITYSTADAFAFDYLRDRVTKKSRRNRPLGTAGCEFDGDEPLLCRRRHTMVIDEIDHILIDEAATPIVLATPISAAQAVDDGVYRLAQDVADGLSIGVDWTLDPTSRRCLLTQRGDTIATQSHPRATLARPWCEYVRRSLDALHTLRRDDDYIVRDGEVAIIDHATGRVSEGRQWQDGLFQAVQQKEQLIVTAETTAQSQITRWRFFDVYKKLAGCSGTAWDCRTEMLRTYRLPAVRIATRLPCQRIAMTPRFVSTAAAKWIAIESEIRDVHASGRPILVGTRTVAETTALAAQLALAGLNSQTLNGTQSEDEASIIGRAGEHGQITIATDMAGRGTDIQIDDEVAQLGGLHVVVTEPRHSVRLDRQLVGRAARGGQPGSYRVFVSADDALVMQYASGLERFLRRQQSPPTSVGTLWRAVGRAANRSEQQMAAARRRLAAQETRRDSYFQQATLSTNESP